jgi:hypothetical protein
MEQSISSPKSLLKSRESPVIDTQILIEEDVRPRTSRGNAKSVEMDATTSPIRSQAKSPETPGDEPIDPRVQVSTLEPLTC